MKKQKGFTLIELVVVMAIVAFLMLVLIAGIIVARNASMDASNRANGQAIRTALESLYSRKSSYDISATPVNWGPTTFDTAIGTGGKLENLGVSLNTQSSSTGCGDVQVKSNTGGTAAQAYTIRIFKQPTCTAAGGIIRTIDGP
jgi:prepilin-type N-terminal cleavage/methylation domain-containing protein